MSKQQEPDPFYEESDKLEWARVKKVINNSSAAYDVTQTEVSYNKGFNTWTIHRMDPRSATTVIDTFYFKRKEAATAALEYIKSIRT